MKKFICYLLSGVLAVASLCFSNVSVFAQGESLEANWSDFERLSKELSNDYYMIMGQPSCYVNDIVEAVAFEFDNIEFEKKGITSKETYNSVLRNFGYNGGYRVTDKPDPLGKFFNWNYYVIPEKTMDYVIQNVFHLEPYHNYSDYNSGYYYNGNYYYQFEGLGGMFPNYYISSYKRLYGGAYYVTASTTSEYAEYGFEPVYMIADLQNFGSFNDWTFYRISDTPINVAEPLGNGAASAYTLPTVSTGNESIDKAYKSTLENLYNSYLEDYSFYDDTRIQNLSTYDINKDGTPEMLIRAGSCEADYTYLVYTYINGKVDMLGSFFGGHCSLFEYSDNGVSILYVYQGYEELYRISMTDNYQLSEIKVGEHDSNIDLKTIRPSTPIDETYSEYYYY